MQHRIAILVETTHASARETLRGVAAFVRDSAADWAIDHEPKRLESGPPEWFRRWRGDGIIARLHCRRTGEAVARTGLPAVDVLGVARHPKVPLVIWDDAAIGRLRDELARAGVADNTLLVVTSDNGTDNVAEAKELRSRWRGREVAGGKYRVNELGTTVPCIVSWPGRSASGTIVTSPIDFTDVLPTLLAAASGSPPEGGDGVSFLPLILGEPPASPRRFAFSWGTLDGSNRVYHEPQARRGAILHAARDSRWRYLSDGRLFDAVADPLMLDPIPPGASADADKARAAMRLAVERLVASHPRLW
jgi:hypothetical protein